ncbi:hypothetical protein HYH02_008834 [Chlamydomonas schloesseri]|uniref:Uncharacterized protein n=1 Tax=Chlamydomonas schloesseri TaxID=2026947 RepID=A0A835WDN4_9CHLO|nr:hypothetical protein HYH02_008834 [Chlamydomonas schloesseri]|eukprot:KAG2445369.1 hypothetical protein HYH02_008834 [Chlamydomonas schloesseri]
MNRAALIATLLLAGYLLGKVITFFLVYKGARWWWRRRAMRREEAARLAEAAARGDDPAAPLLADGSVDAGNETAAVAVVESPDGTMVHIAVAAEPERGLADGGTDGGEGTGAEAPATPTGAGGVRPGGDEV